MDFLSSFTSLPNIHPALVHFPIALAFTALLFELLSLIMPRRKWLENSVAVLYALAATGALAAYFAGREAAEGLKTISAEAEMVLVRHADLALWTTVVLVCAALLRTLAVTLKARNPEKRTGVLRILALLVMIGGAGLVALTADLGGALVFRHGVAVVSERIVPDKTEAAISPKTGADDFGKRLVKSADGGFEWHPTASDGAALGTVITPLFGKEASVAVAPEPGVGLGFDITGESFLLLPGKFDNVTLDARLDLTGFKGTVGLAHHLTAQGDGVLFILSARKRVSLERRYSGKDKVLDKAPAPPSGAVISLRTTKAGHHLKGFVDGKLVLHGHGASGAAGRSGLYVNGRGVIRIISMGVNPAVRH